MTDIILTEIKNGLGIITLNSPKSLNSLSLEMAHALINTLNIWETSAEVECIFLQGNERAFCAGGDVRKLYHALKENNGHQIAQGALDFFINEYTLDYKIHTYKKPIIVWGDAIVMGGGLGLMNGASHRIVTERSMLAMPEITIGLYPDVGATYFLNRMPDSWGYYFGLTGARMNAGDALYLKLADYCIASDKKEDVINELTKSSKDKNSISSVLNKFTAKQIPASPAKERKDFSEKLSLIKSSDDFKSLLTSEAKKDEWLNLALETFNAGSPTSAKVIFEQIKRGRDLSLKEVFQFELNLSVHFSLQPDFSEGVRALLVDKDRNPKWKPATMEAVTDECVETYFTPLWASADHPLKSFI